MYLHSVCILSSAGKASTGTRAAQKRRPLCRCSRSAPAEIVCYGYFSRLARKLPHGQQTRPGCKSWIEGANSAGSSAEWLQKSGGMQPWDSDSALRKAQRTNTGLDPLVSGCTCLGLCFVLPQGCCCLIPSAPAWSRGAVPWLTLKVVPDVLVWLLMNSSHGHLLSLGTT